ncbi:MAG: SBBP repeat-containing protein [Verrucomicrobia bacterium]|nr:SBBP repeat-containing protein [Verrucomicrobiota bacterium]
MKTTFRKPNYRPSPNSGSRLISVLGAAFWSLAALAHGWTTKAPITHAASKTQFILVVVGALLLVPVRTFSADSPVVESWVASYDGPAHGWDYAWAIAVDGAGNVYAAGDSEGINTGSDYTTVKYSSSGALEWVARYNGPANDYDGISALAVDGAGNVYVTGVSGFFFTGNNFAWDYVTIKYSTHGEELWVARYQGPIYEAPRLALDSDGNVYVVGGIGDNPDFITIKYSGSGQEVWVATYDGPNNAIDYATAVAVDAVGNVLVSGRTDTGRTDTQVATIKYNSGGEVQWVALNNRAYGSPSLALDSNANVFLTAAGEIYQNGAWQPPDYVTIKYNANGVLQWVTTYNGPSDSTDMPIAVATDADGNAYVTGISYALFEDYATVKYSPDGKQVWVARFDAAGGSDLPSALAVDKAGNVYVTGYSYVFAPTEDAPRIDFATVKYDKDGKEQWVALYDSGVTEDYGTSLATDNAGNVYVGGYTYSWIRGGSSDWATVKYQGSNDSDPPILKLPADITAEATGSSGAVVEFSATALDQVEGEVPVSCRPSSGSTFALGSTTVNCSASDSRGNTAYGSFEVTVQDTTAPATTILSAVSGDGALLADGGQTLSGSAGFAFGGSDLVGVASFECRLDGAPFTPRSSPALYTGLGIGVHTFEVRAVDSAGNADPTPATLTWTVLTAGQAAQNLATFIDNLGLVRSIRTSLGATLQQATSLLTDANSKNDVSACGKLGAFLNEVDSMERRGQLTADQAAQLRGQAAAIRGSLGCP